MSENRKKTPHRVPEQHKKAKFAESGDNMRINLSISTRLSAMIIIFTGILFVSSLLAIFNFSKKLIRREAFTNAAILLDNINNEANAFFILVSLSVDNASLTVTENSNLPPDSLYSITRKILQNSPNIKGSAIAFQPGATNAYTGPYAPYTYRKGNGIIDTQLDNGTEPYTQSQWFRKAKEENRSIWSDPYFDASGSQEMVFTYSRPFYNDKNQFMGVVTADISINWLCRNLERIKPYREAMMHIIDRNGNLIVKHGELTAGENISARRSDEPLASPDMAGIRNDMVAGKEGWAVYRQEGRPMFIFYQPIEELGWSMYMTCPASAIFREVHMLAIWISIVMAAALIIMFISSYRIIHKVLSPLTTLTEAANMISGGNLHAPLPAIRTNDEITQLSNAFSKMQDSLNRYIKSLKRETGNRERMESELRIAGTIQNEMLPDNMPDYGEGTPVDLYSVLIPAKAVGGDLYDYIKKGDTLRFIIGDVSGKGIPASILMATAISLFRSAASIYDTPEEIIGSINKEISQRNRLQMFVTLQAGKIDLVRNELQICNAGHTRPIMVRHGGEARYLEVTPNLPAGIIKDFSYRSDSYSMTPGDTLLLYTDGLTEAENDKGEQIGEKGVLDMLGRASAYPPQAIVMHLLDKVKEHAGNAERNDDTAIIAIRTGNDRPFKLEIKNSLEELEKLPPYIRMILQGHETDAGIPDKLNLALEELLTNTISYGYKTKKPETITVTSYVHDGKITIHVSDTGEKFDITSQAPDVELDATAEERKIGGLGIFLINKIMDSVEYSYLCGKNTVTLTKQLKTPTDR